MHGDCSMFLTTHFSKHSWVRNKTHAASPVILPEFSIIKKEVWEQTKGVETVSVAWIESQGFYHEI